MLNDKDGVEVLYFGGSYWPNGASSDVFCPLIMQAKIVDNKITGFDGTDDFGALYLDCSLDSTGPWFSIDAMSSSGTKLMYGLGVARDRNFDHVENKFMLVYKWKYLGKVPTEGNPDDYYFTNCKEPVAENPSSGDVTDPIVDNTNTGDTN